MVSVIESILFQLNGNGQNQKDAIRIRLSLPMNYKA